MKVLILSDPENTHTHRWVSSLAERGIDIYLFGLNGDKENFYRSYPNVQVEVLECMRELKGQVNDGAWQKVKYLKAVFRIRKIIRSFRPDILHAHYATSYGMLGICTAFHPLIISAWGSDIYCFPKVSFLHRKILEFNLKHADYLLSTSHVMAEEMRRYTNRAIGITPFGVNTDLFKPTDKIAKKDKFVIGTVKTLLPIYGIDLLIRAFAQVRHDNPDVQLVIVGAGNDEAELKQLVKNLNLEGFVSFPGRIENSLLPDVINSFDVFVALSRSESFGVAAIEAMACECPVIVSDVDGFKEVVVDGETGYIVPSENPAAAADKIRYLMNNRELLKTIGKNGRKRVIQLYDWKENVNSMLAVYNKIYKCNAEKKE